MNPGLGFFSSFDKSISQARSDNVTFKYWDTFICLIQQVENLVCADCDGDWALHMQAVQAFLPIFAAIYTDMRWCSLYVEDMLKLPVNAPGVYKVFSDGKYVVRRTQGMLNAVYADMAIRADNQ
jgi:hypothetical protein